MRRKGKVNRSLQGKKFSRLFTLFYYEYESGSFTGLGEIFMTSASLSCKYLCAVGLGKSAFGTSLTKEPTRNINETRL